MWFTSGSVTKAKEAKEDAEYSKVTDTLRTDLEAKLTAAAGFLTEDLKLANLDADGTLATTQSDLKSAKTALDAAVAAVKPDLDFQKTKTSAAAKVTELDALVNIALKAELQRQVNELTKDRAAQATTMLANLTSLKESLESLQTLVSDGLKMQVDYPQKYYDADNKEAFDAALLKASSVFPAFVWTTNSIMVETPEGQLPNPRAWTKAREKSEFKLQNFVMAPAQAAPATQSDSTAATVRLATGEAAAEAETQPAASTADLASTVSYLKTLDTDLKAQTAALNGDTTTNKTAYYKPVDGRTLYWDGFMPKIVVQGYVADGAGNGKATHEDANKTKLEAWFAANQDKFTLVADQLTRKLGSDKFKNVVLTSPMVSYEEVTVNSNAWKNPKVTFNIQAKPGYQLTEPTTNSKQISLTIRVLYENQASTQNLLTIQGASPTAAPNTASVGNPATAIKSVNVYLNYTGPAIMLNADLPIVGGQENTSINGTSNVTGEFNTAFRGNPSKGLLFTNRYANPLLKSVINYVNKFDPKYRAKFVTNSINGVTITKVQNKKELRPGNLEDLLYNNNVFLQQVQDDSSAVYFAITALTNDKWLNTVLVRIPLTKFVKPLTAFTATPASAPTQTDSGTGAQTQPEEQS
ncbi:hypothetical protein [Mycoplasmopsis synoviae]|uniref:Putative phase-variable hemagglutinin n=1 Tax=Mycoplasmopsis synoviae (strain 53) TaxID=262723 RepID=Q4A6I6_MYCS5|nr:hypothetical protein [Mycoplasmopsis synoviae]AAZ43635.2 putative phase-variable hemagglutinin [Mycoplasmopsis synoviae 53]